MLFDLLIRNGRVYSGVGDERADIAIAGGKIIEIGQLSEAKADQILDATGLAVFPGIIDSQVHFREPGAEHKEDIESGTRAAIYGGVTSVLEMPNTNPTTATKAALQDKVERATDRAWCNIGFFVGATAGNIDQLPELENLPGTPGIKIFMGSSTGSLLVPDDDTLRKVLRAGKKRMPVHAEDHYRLEERKSLISTQPTVAEHPFLRDAECARLASQRMIALSEETGTPIHILHVSTADEIPLIKDAKSQGISITAEVTPQHLFFSAPKAYDLLGTLAQMNPPVRCEEHRQALRQAVRDGVFDVIGSDHAPHTLQEKAQPYPKSPSGMPGVQTLVPVMLTMVLRDRLISIHEFVRLACERPARLYNIKGKGSIQPGFDADLVLVDLQATRKLERSWIQSKCGWSPYEGVELQGWPVHTIVNGYITVRDGAHEGMPHGRVLEFGE